MTTILYARQSSDRSGEAVAVERQITECRNFARARGLVIDEEIIDNDVSATSGIVRPGFERMLTSEPTAIIAWHQDRLFRLGRDLERLIDLEIPINTVTSGFLDLSYPAGRAVARTVAVWSQYEGEQKGVRQQAANRQRAAAGVWQFSNRPYGYERQNGVVVIVESEAAIIQEALTRYLAGETQYSIVADLNRRKVPTLKGGTWTASQLRDRLTNPAYTGLRYYKGQLMGEGNWPAIIPREQWTRFTVSRASRSRAHSWSNRTKYLLSGLAICGVCGANMFARPEYGRKLLPDGTKPVRMTYQCTAAWCVSRGLELVDDLVTRTILARLSLEDARQILTPRLKTAPLLAELDDLRQRHAGLAELVAEGLLTVESVREQSPPLQARIGQLEVKLFAAEGGSEFSELIAAEDISEHWHTLMVRAQRRVVSALLTVTIHRQKSTRTFDPRAIQIEWVQSPDLAV